MPATLLDRRSIPAPLLDTTPLSPYGADRTRLQVAGRLLQGLLLLTAFAVVLLAILPTALGYKGEVVLSGSMRPLLQVGDVTYVRPLRTGDLRVGKIVTFHAPGLGQGVLVTHRIIATTGTGTHATLTTKGDNNPVADSFLTPATSVVGTYAFKVPHLGTILAGLRDRTHYIVFASLLFLLVLIHEGKVIVSEVHNRKRTRTRRPTTP